MHQGEFDHRRTKALNDIDSRNLTLDEVNQGEVMMRANRELARIIKDIADPNKVAVSDRELVIKLKFKPNKQRSAATVKCSVSHKPGAYVEQEGDIYLGVDKATGEAIAKPYV